MFSHLILGLLRDGRCRHGYELMTEYAARSGTKASAGSFYRELARLVADGLVATETNPPDTDARRIPYRIEEQGREVFDQWLASPAMDDGDLSIWLIFADRASDEARTRVLDRHEEDLWMRSKTLNRLRDDALAQRGRAGTGYDPLPILLSKAISRVAAELQFLREFRTEFEAWKTSERMSTHVSKGDASRAAPRPKRGALRR